MYNLTYSIDELVAQFETMNYNYKSKQCIDSVIDDLFLELTHKYVFLDIYDNINEQVADYIDEEVVRHATEIFNRASESLKDRVLRDYVINDYTTFKRAVAKKQLESEISSELYNMIVTEVLIELQFNYDINYISDEQLNEIYDYVIYDEYTTIEDIADYIYYMIF